MRTVMGVLLMLLMGAPAWAQRMPEPWPGDWESSVQVGIERATREGRLLMVLVTPDGRMPLPAELLADTDDFVRVHIVSWGQGESTLWLCTSTGEVLNRLSGPLDVQDLWRELRFVRELRDRLTAQGPRVRRGDVVRELSWTHQYAMDQHRAAIATIDRRLAGHPDATTRQLLLQRRAAHERQWRCHDEELRAPLRDVRRLVPPPPPSPPPDPEPPFI